MEKLSQAAKKVSEGERPKVTVREFISWFGYTRRHAWAIGRIRRELYKMKLKTEPDFDWTYLDGQVTLLPAEEPEAKQIEDAKTSPISVAIDGQLHLTDALETATREVIEPTYRIGRLQIGKTKPEGVGPDVPIEQAVGLMLRNDFSQLPVMTGERSVHGVFSWRTLGSIRAWGRSVSMVREAMDDRFKIVSEDTTLFEVIPLIEPNDCVLVSDSSNRIRGIITAFDITKTFGILGEPFLVLGEIENHIRSFLEGKFTREQLLAGRDPEDSTRTVDRVSDLTFGEYLRLLENPENWAKIGLRIPRARFVAELEEIRRIRNGVMHFDPEGIEDADLRRLRGFVEFLQRLYKLKPQ